MRPIINGLALLYDLLFDEFVLAIIVFTLIMRLILMPLMIRQTRQMKKLQGIQPRMKTLKEKYKDQSPESRRRLSEETMRLYKEAGVNPVGCLGPFVIQLPIWIGLYRAILRVVPTTPERLVDLSNTFYSWNPSSDRAPFDPFIFGIDLAAFTSVAGIPWNFALAVLVGVSTWLQQRVSTPVSVDPRQQQTNQMLLWMMPVMLAVFSWNFPAGLAVYILFSNLIGVVIQYFVGGKQPISIMGRLYLGTPETREAFIKNRAELQNEAQAAKDSSAISTSNQRKIDEATQEVHRQNRRRGNRSRSPGSRRRARRR